MVMNDPKDVLSRYLDAAHDALLWKLDGLTEYDVRRPLTSTGTNLLGVIKHLAWVEFGYFGETFHRPHGETFPANHEEPNADMYASAEESRDDILSLFGRARAHAAETIDTLDLEDEGHVPWWGDGGNPVTLQRIMVHMIAETNRHLGQLDILRESLDGAVGLRQDNTNMGPGDDDYWLNYCEQLEQIATEANN